ncbi:hypothetical protein [Flavobacterium selenitireducens]|uniref:hypothetical protein n=1 Tax=Flavobacterium selenitireducens TaxID=2722704 RepID=UPI00168AD05E|nr:hypothetical protein [Flavobacterium selenitireducens]MBD3581220.1 hypothetical protein [Flavobacterium selenitireducens]
MKTHFLFPQKFDIIGWCLFVPALLVAIAAMVSDLQLDDAVTAKVYAIADNGLFAPNGFFRFNENSIGDEILLSFLIAGGLFIGFSKQKNEDELIAQIRYESLVWATYFNFTVMLVATWLIYGLFYFEVMVANIFSLLLFFIIRFHIKLYQLKNSVRDDE